MPSFPHPGWLGSRGQGGTVNTVAHKKARYARRAAEVSGRNALCRTNQVKPACHEIRTLACRPRDQQPTQRQTCARRLSEFMASMPQGS